LLPIGAVFGKLERPSFVGEFQRATEEGNSLRRAPMGYLQGGSFTADYERRPKEKSGNGASLSIGSGKLECGLLYWELRQLHVKESFGNPSLYRGCVRRTWGLISCGL
jgi:hypothetical protein